MNGKRYAQASWASTGAQDPRGGPCPVAWWGFEGDPSLGVGQSPGVSSALTGGIVALGVEFATEPSERERWSEAIQSSCRRGWRRQHSGTPATPPRSGRSAGRRPPLNEGPGREPRRGEVPAWSWSNEVTRAQRGPGREPRRGMSTADVVAGPAGGLPELVGAVDLAARASPAAKECLAPNPADRRPAPRGPGEAH
jgi:hypothetical protein